MPESFDEFYRRNYQPLVRYLLTQGADFSAAEDAANTAMFETAKVWETLRNPKGFLFKVATNAFKKEQNMRKRQAEIAHKLGRAEHHDTPGAGAQVHRDETALSYRAEVEIVRTVLAGLPPAQREVLAYYMDGYRPSDIARLVGKTPAAVRSNLQVARKKLCELLEKQGVDTAERKGGKP